MSFLVMTIYRDHINRKKNRRKLRLFFYSWYIYLFIYLYIRCGYSWNRIQDICIDSWDGEHSACAFTHNIVGHVPCWNRDVKPMDHHINMMYSPFKFTSRQVHPCILFFSLSLSFYKNDGDTIFVNMVT